MGAGNSSDVNFEEFDFDSVATGNKYIDRGSFGEVYGPFTWNSKKCALKRIRISQSGPGDGIEKKVKEQENIWTSLKHKNLIEVYSVISKPKTLYIVMEYASGGSLLKCILDNSDGTYFWKISNWARQIAEGMVYLHEANIVHRDLKPNNIMLVEPFDPVNAQKNITIKITDFDQVRELEHTTTMSFRGTIAYMAPEVLQTERFSKSSDIWSFGVMILEMLTRKRAHEDLREAVIIQKAASGQLMLHIPEYVSESYKKLLHGCLHNDKDRRLSIQSISDQLLSIENEENKSKFDELKEKMKGNQTEQTATQSANKVYYKEDPVLIKTIKTKAAEEDRKGISGLAIADNDLFMTSFKTNDIEVYDLKSLTLNRSWRLDPLMNPYDLGYCNVNKCLYMMDTSYIDYRKKIFRVDRNGKLLKSWTTGMGYGCISVTYDCNVVMVAFESYTITEFTPDGQIVREIKLSRRRGFVHPHHAIKLANDLLLISHGEEGDPLHRVCVVDTNGDIQMSFGGQCGSTSNRLFVPIFLAIDSSGSIIVVDRDNSRVVLLSSNLEFLREIISTGKEGMRRPERIAVDQANGRLLVAHNDPAWSECRVFVFEIL